MKVKFFLAIVFPLFFSAFSMEIKDDGKQKAQLMRDALKKGDIKLIEFFIRQEIALNELDALGEIPFHFAIQYATLPVIVFLNEQGGDIKSQNEQLETPLHHAIKRGDKEIVLYLLKQGALVNVANRIGQTPLHSAVQQDNAELTYILLEREASANSVDNEGNTPLHLAVRQKDTSRILALLLKTDITLKNTKQQMALHCAAQHGYTNVVSLLLDNGYNKETKDGSDKPYKASAGSIEQYTFHASGRTILHYAVIYGHDSLIQSLIDRNVDIEAKDNAGNTPLHLAAAYGRTSIAQMLLKAGAHVNASSRDYYASFPYNQQLYYDRVGFNGNCVVMPLHFAAAYGHIPMVEMLIAHGAEVDAGKDNSYSNSYHTPLHFAAENGHEDIVCYLLDKGAKIDNLFRGCISALYLAAENGHLPVVKLLIDRGSKQELMKYYTAEGMPIHRAAENGHMNVVAFFLDRGMDVNIRAYNGETPLHMAAHGGHYELVAFLIGRNACLNVQDDIKRTPLEYAAYEDAAGRNNSSDCLRTIRTLLDSGLYIHLNTDILDVARDWGKKYNLDMIKMLLLYGACFQDKRQREEIAYQLRDNKILYAALSQQADSFLETLSTFDVKGEDQKKVIEDINTAFVILAGLGDIVAISSMLATYKEILQQTTYDRAFISAAFSGYSEILTLFKEYQLINDSIAARAFITATFSDRLDILRYLYSNWHICPMAMSKALGQACLRNHVSIIKFILEADFAHDLKINLTFIIDQLKEGEAKDLIQSYRQRRSITHMLQQGPSSNHTQEHHISFIPREVIRYIMSYYL